MIQASSFLALIVLVASILIYRVTNNVSSAMWFVLLVFACMLVISNYVALFTAGSTSFLRMAAILAFIFVGLLLAYRREHRIIERAMPVYGFGLILVLVYVLIDNNRMFTRLSGHMHPNHWGYLIVSSLPFIIFARAGAFWRAMAIVFMLYLLAFEFQSRSALVWFLLMLAVFVPVKVMSEARSAVFKAWAVVIYVYLAVSFLLIGVLLFGGLAADILHLNSATRGVGSGLSGRTGLWAAALEVFWQNALFGSGFDSSRYYAVNFFNVLVKGKIESLHNSYLTMFFEMGLVGGFWYLLIIGGALAGAFYSRNVTLIAFMLANLAMGLTESRPLNVGNPSGVVFVILLPGLFQKWLLIRRRRTVRSRSPS